MRSHFAGIFRNLLKNNKFKDSKSYWAERYASGGTSGAGSYGRYARFKADVINRLVAEEGIHSVVELGCGDGHQAMLFAVERYIGLDIAKEAIDLCEERLASRAGFECHLYDPADFGSTALQHVADAALSLDVIYHLVEDAVYERYLQQLFELGREWVIIYSSNKNSIPWLTHRHVKHRKFMEDVERLAPGWELAEFIPNAYPANMFGFGGSFADFYVFRRQDY